MDETAIHVTACRGRQQRLLQQMAEQGLDLVIVNQREHVQYLFGPHFAGTFQPAAALTSAGEAILVAPERRMPPRHAADRLLGYAAQWHSTLRNDQRQASTEVLCQALGPAAFRGRLGVEFSCYARFFPDSGTLYDIEPILYRLRRRKEPDELARIRRAVTATERMFARARSILQPGINELDVFSELQAVAVRECGEMLTGTGNDYQSGSRGGPPRDRAIQAGELYILDLGPAFRGYFADNTRTFPVGEPTAAQRQAWEFVVRALEHVERSARPGKSARALFDEASAILQQSPRGTFNHHLGHGIGLFPHEAPHLNPAWDDTLEIGDVFAVEPGLYAPELAAGLRIENNYLVTSDGVERLTDFPLGWDESG